MSSYKTSGYLLTTLFFVILCGCSAHRPVQDISIPIEGRDASSRHSVEAAEEISVTTASRILPDFYVPGEKLTVKIEVSPWEGITGVIIEENLPDNWQIQDSKPDFVKEDGGAYKWLFFARELSDFIIEYRVAVSPGSSGEKEFRGSVITHREKKIEIGGDTAIRNRDSSR